MLNGTLVTIAIFVAGLIWHSGQLAQRLTHIEEWRRELRQDMKDISNRLDTLAALIRGEEQ